MDDAKIKRGLQLFLEGLQVEDDLFDLDVAREAILEEWRDEFLSGYQQDPAKILKTNMSTESSQMVMMQNIRFVSFCVHHFLPFSGVVHLAYLPDKKITGLSRLVKLVDCFARRLQIQERLGNQITDALMMHLAAQGAACLIKADQYCVIARGVKKNARTITTSFKGVFLNDTLLRQEFLELCRD